MVRVGGAQRELNGACTGKVARKLTMPEMAEKRKPEVPNWEGASGRWGLSDLAAKARRAQASHARAAVG